MGLNWEFTSGEPGGRIGIKFFRSMELYILKAVISLYKKFLLLWSLDLYTLIMDIFEKGRYRELCVY